MRVARLCAVAAGGMLVAACSTSDPGPKTGAEIDARTNALDPYHYDIQYMESGHVAPEEHPGFLASLGIGDNSGKGTPSVPGIGVNSYLWRASLDTIKFMPLASADPFGGVIITEWYSPPNEPNERFKLNVFILGRELRADGISVSVFHQRRDAEGQWADAPVDPKTNIDLEDSILTRARQLRLSTASAG